MGRERAISYSQRIQASLSSSSGKSGVTLGICKVTHSSNYTSNPRTIQTSVRIMEFVQIFELDLKFKLHGLKSSRF